MFSWNQCGLTLVAATITLIYPASICRPVFYTGTDLMPTSTTTFMVTAALIVIIGLSSLGNKITVSPSQQHVPPHGVYLLMWLIILITVRYAHTITGMNTVEFNIGLRNPLASIHPVTLTIASISAANITKLGLQKISKVQQTSLGLNAAPSTVNLVIGLFGVTIPASMWWAQQELFWGSFWNWDSVETSLLVIAGCTLLLTHLPKNKTARGDYVLTAEALVLTLVLFYYHNKSSKAGSVHAFTNSLLAKVSLSTLLALIVPLIILPALKLMQGHLSNVSERIGSLKKRTWITSSLRILLTLPLCQFFINTLMDRNVFQYQTIEAPLLAGISALVITQVVYPTTNHKVGLRHRMVYKHARWWVGLVALASLKLELLNVVVALSREEVQWQKVTAFTGRSVRLSLTRAPMWAVETERNSSYTTIKGAALWAYTDASECSIVSVQKKHSNSIYAYPTTGLVLARTALVYLTYSALINYSKLPSVNLKKKNYKSN